jgi:hypothetical protein
MEGQLMTIRIFKSEYQPVQKLSKYWYVVEFKGSPYYGRASIIWSDLHHSASPEVSRASSRISAVERRD